MLSGGDTGWRVDVTLNTFWWGYRVEGGCNYGRDDSLMYSMNRKLIVFEYSPCSEPSVHNDSLVRTKYPSDNRSTQRGNPIIYIQVYHRTIHLVFYSVCRCADLYNVTYI